MLADRLCVAPGKRQVGSVRQGVRTGLADGGVSYLVQEAMSSPAAQVAQRWSGAARTYRPPSPVSPVGRC